MNKIIIVSLILFSSCSVFGQIDYGNGKEHGLTKGIWDTLPIGNYGSPIDDDIFFIKKGFGKQKGWCDSAFDENGDIKSKIAPTPEPNSIEWDEKYIYYTNGAGIRKRFNR